MPKTQEHDSACVGATASASAAANVAAASATANAFTAVARGGSHLVCLRRQQSCKAGT